MGEGQSLHARGPNYSPAFSELSLCSNVSLILGWFGLFECMMFCINSSVSLGTSVSCIWVFSCSVQVWSKQGEGQGPLNP